MDVEAPILDTEPVPAGQGVLAPESKPGARLFSILRHIVHGLAIVALAMASYFLISHFFVQSVKVVGKSMVPTLNDSQHYLLNRWVYYLRSPQRADVVVIRDPSDGGYSVKRIIAVSGDAICLKEGNVYVNNRKLDESYLGAGTPTFINSKSQIESLKCGKDQFFLLGDNRMNSVDSRVYGLVPRQNILGLIIR